MAERRTVQFIRCRGENQWMIVCQIVILKHLQYTQLRRGVRFTSTVVTDAASNAKANISKISSEIQYLLLNYLLLQTKDPLIHRSTAYKSNCCSFRIDALYHVRSIDGILMQSHHKPMSRFDPFVLLQ